VLLLALDTATPAVTVAVTRGVETLATATRHEPRRHGEVLAPMVVDVLQAAALDAHSLDAVVVGVGPGPFTGLRVGLVTARTLGAVLGVPVLGVCTLDALALASDLPEPLLVATDARRREVYWATYDERRDRLTGPQVSRPAEVGWSGPVVGEGGTLYPDDFPQAQPPSWPSAQYLARWVEQRRPTLPPDPLYLRRPDAAEPGPRKSVL
jgi:tRNA threonylcarbamoyl adenosine modification protein YeaZ